MQKFFAFLDHGQIRAVSCVEDFIEAHAMEHVDDLAHHVFALWQIEGVADSHSYCRSDLRDDFRVRISQCFPYRIHIGIDADRSSRAYDAALSASYAVRRVQQLVECRSYRGRCSAGCEVDGIDSLHVVAHADTVAAKDAFVRIPYDGRGTCIDLMVRHTILVRNCGHAHAMSQLLQMAFAALDAGGAVSVVSCQKQFQYHFTVFHQSRRVGVDHHAVFWLFGAGGKRFALFIFYRAKAARAVYGKLRVIA